MIDVEILSFVWINRFMGLCCSSVEADPVVDRSSASRQEETTILQCPYVGVYRAKVVALYDGDTFTCQFEHKGNIVETPIRIIGFNSEEIKDKTYSVLDTRDRNNELEHALFQWFHSHKKRGEMKNGWSKYKKDVTKIDDLWFRRINALTAKYALIEALEANDWNVTLDIPNLRPSFQRILAHAYFGQEKKTSVCKWMIDLKYGYPYRTKATSV